MPKFSFKDQQHFPFFADLSGDNDVSSRYYDDHGTGHYGPIKHWCLLGEIVETVPYLRPMIKVKDKAGKVFLVAFYFDKEDPPPDGWTKHAKPGNAISIMYADRHYFMDGQVGVRLEDVDRVKMFPCSLEELISIGERVDKILESRHCHQCTANAVHKCASCTVRYCNRECQKRHWSQSHKKECQALKQVIEWKGKNWRRFDGTYWM